MSRSSQQASGERSGRQRRKRAGCLGQRPPSPVVSDTGYELRKRVSLTLGETKHWLAHRDRSQLRAHSRVSSLEGTTAAAPRRVPVPPGGLRLTSIHSREHCCARALDRQWHGDRLPLLSGARPAVANSPTNHGRCGLEREASDHQSSREAGDAPDDCSRMHGRCAESGVAGDRAANRLPMWARSWWGKPAGQGGRQTRITRPLPANAQRNFSATAPMRCHRLPSPSPYQAPRPPVVDGHKACHGRSRGHRSNMRERGVRDAGT